MKVNANKFQLIIFSKQVTENVSIHVDGHVTENEPVVKLLGLYIDDLLNFDAHVDNICRKAERKLNVLARLSCVLNVECKLLLFYSFILSHFEYCTAIWYFFSRDKMRKMEKLQKRALRYVYKDLNSAV